MPFGQLCARRYRGRYAAFHARPRGSSTDVDRERARARKAEYVHGREDEDAPRVRARSQTSAQDCRSTLPAKRRLQAGAIHRESPANRALRRATARQGVRTSAISRRASSPRRASSVIRTNSPPRRTLLRARAPSVVTVLGRALLLVLAPVHVLGLPCSCSFSIYVRARSSSSIVRVAPDGRRLVLIAEGHFTIRATPGGRRPPSRAASTRGNPTRRGRRAGSGRDRPRTSRAAGSPSSRRARACAPRS